MALKIIRIPRTPTSAFQKEREVSTLLRAQVEHAAEAEQRLPRQRQTRVATESIATEHEAAEYIGQVMKRLHHNARKTWRLPPGTRAPKSGVWLGPSRLSASQPAKKARKRSKVGKKKKAGKKR
jgi:hypothetical protein